MTRGLHSSLHVFNGAAVLPAGDGAVITVVGSFAAPPGPDWGWDIVLTPQPGAALSMLMHIYTPEGEMAPAVEAAYTPG